MLILIFPNYKLITGEWPGSGCLSISVFYVELMSIATLSSTHGSSGWCHRQMKWICLY